MGIYRRYNWHHRDQDFWYEREWPSEWHRHLRSIRGVTSQTLRPTGAS